MVETFECVCYIIKHGDLNQSAIVVPIQIKPKVAFACSVVGDRIVFLENRQEMFYMFFTNLLDTEIINAKGERDGPPIVCPETRGELTLAVPLFVQPFLEELLGKESALGQSVHAASDFDVDVTIGGHFGCESVLLDKIIWEITEL